MDELAKQFAALAAKYGPGITDAALGAVRTEVYSSLTASAFAIGISLALAGGSLALLRSRKKPVDGDRRWSDIDDRNMMKSVAAAAGFIIAAAMSLAGSWAFIDPWTWAALNHPELWLAKQALHI